MDEIIAEIYIYWGSEEYRDPDDYELDCILCMSDLWLDQYSMLSSEEEKEAFLNCIAEGVIDQDGNLLVDEKEWNIK